jgi:hypothetical protein
MLLSQLLLILHQLAHEVEIGGDRRPFALDELVAEMEKMYVSAGQA